MFVCAFILHHYSSRGYHFRRVWWGRSHAYRSYLVLTWLSGCPWSCSAVLCQNDAKANHLFAMAMCMQVETPWEGRPKMAVSPCTVALRHRGRPASSLEVQFLVVKVCTVQQNVKRLCKVVILINLVLLRPTSNCDIYLQEYICVNWICYLRCLLIWYLLIVAINVSFW